MGIVPGNRVLLRGPNNPMLVASWLAVMKAGAIAVTTMPLLRAQELCVIAERAQIDHAICDVRLALSCSRRRATGGMSRIVNFGDVRLEALMAQQPTIQQCPTLRMTFVCSRSLPERRAFPKATMHFHRDVLAMREIVAGHLLETSPDDIYVGSPPLGFTFGLGALLVFPLGSRGAVARRATQRRNLLAAVHGSARLRCLLRRRRIAACCR